MKVIQKEIMCRVGQDWHNKRLFIGELVGLDREIANLVCEELAVTPEDLHRKTCSIKIGCVRSISGDPYLAEKVIKLKIAVVFEAELIDDAEAVELNPDPKA